MNHIIGRIYAIEVVLVFLIFHGFFVSFVGVVFGGSVEWRVVVVNVLHFGVARKETPRDDVRREACQNLKKKESTIS